MIGSGGEVLGRHIVMMFGGKLDIEIVGVVDDLFTDIRDAEPLALYMPMAQHAQPVVNRSLVFRAADDVRAAQREVGRDGSSAGFESAAASRTDT